MALAKNPTDETFALSSIQPKYPYYNDIRDRLESFESWPISLHQKPAVMAEAGFFYFGKGDQVVCFHCGRGIMSWKDNDDPWEEHAIWSTKCEYVISKKSESFIEQAVDCNNTCQKEGSFSRMTCKHAAPLGRKRKTSLVLNSEVDPNSNSEICLKCKQNKSDVAFLPCYHTNTCSACVQEDPTCPACNKKSDYMKLYFQ